MNQTRVVKIFLIVMVVLYIIGTSYGGLIRKKGQPNGTELKEFRGKSCDFLKEKIKERFEEQKWLKFLSPCIECVECKDEKQMEGGV